jgi:hypothetical protein
MMDPLPSQQSAALLMSGEPLAIFPVLAHAAGRGALIFLGACLFGSKIENAAKAAIGGALTIEAFVLLYQLRQETKDSPADLLPSGGGSVSVVDAPPSLVPIPAGWRYPKNAAEVPSLAVARAGSFLRESAMGQFEDHSTWGLIKEWHKDDHVSPGTVKWHPGVTVLVPATVAV